MRVKVKRKYESAVRETHHCKRMFQSLQKGLEEKGEKTGDPSFIFVMDTGSYTLLTGNI